MNITGNFISQFQQKVLDTIRTGHLIEQGEGIVVGLSGGPDSVCLIHVLHSLSEALRIKLYAVHINHMLRDGEAKADEQYASELCRELGIWFSAVRVDVGAMAQAQGLSLEEAGREARYGEFSRAVQSVGAAKIAVAHNRNDQAETVMMNIIRGSGMAGLVGMEYKRGNIIRPLLNITRDEIEQYCTEAGLSPRTDSSNLTQEFTRNRVRLGLFPYIRENFGADMVDSLCRLSAHAAQDNSFLDACAQNAYEDMICMKGTGMIELRADKLLLLDPSIRSRVFKLALIHTAGSSAGFGSIHYRSLSELVIKGRTGGQAELPGGIRAIYSYGILKITDSGVVPVNFAPVRFCRTLDIPGTVFIAELDAEVTTTVLSDFNIDNYRSLGYNPFMQFFDYVKLNKGMNIRNRQEGDVFKPFLSNGTKKLKEYFIDSKIPREQRGRIPLLCTGHEVVWVIGDKISDKFKVTENTKSVIKIVYNRRAS